MPLHWLELRWFGRKWCWRALGAVDRTVGAGTADAEGWRPFARGVARPRVRLDGLGWVELVDPSEPSMLLHDLRSGDRLEAEDVHEYVEVCDDGIRPLDALELAPLLDGQVFTVGDRVLRMLLADTPRHTSATGIDLRDAACQLDVGDGEAVFTVGTDSRTLWGESARVLRVYASARIHSGEGWLAPIDAYAEWVAVGGHPESPAERVAWERGKVRSRLVLAGAGGVPELFESKREGMTILVRLSLPPGRITVDGRGPTTSGGKAGQGRRDPLR